MLENEKTNPNPSAPPLEATHLPFPEDKIQGQGYSQFDPKTGWLWIGIKLPAFNFRTAWAFVKSQEYVMSSAFDNIEGERMRKMALANPKKGNILAPLMAGFRK